VRRWASSLPRLDWHALDANSSFSLPFLLFCVLDFVFVCFGFCLSAHNLYPLRIRVVNEITEQDMWLTAPYNPIVKKGKEAGAEVRARRRRAAILQQVLYLVFRSAMAASHVGVKVGVGHRTLLAFPRLLLYICDLPEEKGILCLKGGKTPFSSSLCRVPVQLAGAPQALEAADRDALAEAKEQVEAANLLLKKERPSRRLYLEKKHTAHSRIPALAGMAVLTTEPFLLYKMIGLDALHVRLRPVLRCASGESFFSCANGCEVQLYHCVRRRPLLTLVLLFSL